MHSLSTLHTTRPQGLARVLMQGSRCACCQPCKLAVWGELKLKGVGFWGVTLEVRAAMGTSRRKSCAMRRSTPGWRTLTTTSRGAPATLILARCTCSRGLWSDLDLDGGDGGGSVWLEPA